MHLEKKKIVIIAALALLAVILWLLPNLIPGAGDPSAVTRGGGRTEEKTEETAEPEETAAPEADKEKTQEQPFLDRIAEDDPATAYVLVRMPEPVGLLPLPQEGEYTRTVRQTMEDGSEWLNVLHLTPEGFRMEDANCPGKDCVNEGKVTLENREERVLMNMVICLPHRLTLELLTRKEAEQIIGR